MIGEAGNSAEDPSEILMCPSLTHRVAPSSEYHFWHSEVLGGTMPNSLSSDQRFLCSRRVSLCSQRVAPCSSAGDKNTAVSTNLSSLVHKDHASASVWQMLGREKVHFASWTCGRLWFEHMRKVKLLFECRYGVNKHMCHLRLTFTREGILGQRWCEHT